MMKVPCFCGHVMGIPIEKHTLAFTFCFHPVNFRDCRARGNPIASTIDVMQKWRELAGSVQACGG